MEHQLPLFARELSPADQQTIREALTLLECQLRETGASFTSAMPSATGCACSSRHWSGKSLPRSFSITSIA